MANVYFSLLFRFEIQSLSSSSSTMSLLSIRFPSSTSSLHCLVFPSRSHSSFDFSFQISTNNCTARYRTLSGGLGNSPSLSPSPSSDYEDIGIGAPRALPPSLAAKVKKNGAIATKSNTISQKATIHHVSISGMKVQFRFSFLFFFFFVSPCKSPSQGV